VVVGVTVTDTLAFAFTVPTQALQQAVPFIAVFFWHPHVNLVLQFEHFIILIFVGLLITDN